MNVRHLATSFIIQFVTELVEHHVVVNLHVSVTPWKRKLVFHHAAVVRCVNFIKKHCIFALETYLVKTTISLSRHLIDRLRDRELMFKRQIKLVHVTW